jgi:hypothetical protein
VRKKNEEEEKERWQYVEYRGKDLLSFPSEKQKKKRKKYKKERECTSGPGPDQSVSNDDAMLMNDSIVDDSFLCVSLSLPYYQRRLASSSLSLLFAFL